jgi:uncharacterized protein
MTVGPVDRDPATAEFFDAAADGRFLLRRCPDSHYSEPAAAQCTACASRRLAWVPAAGGASIVSWAVAWSKPGHGSDQVPTVLVIAEFDEGPWWWSCLDGADPARLTVGTRLKIAFREGGGEVVPVFELAG